MPLRHLHDLTSRHQQAQEQAIATAQKLTMSATQLRAVQKRLLLAAADRHPARVDHLQMLLHETGQQLRGLGVKQWYCWCLPLAPVGVATHGCARGQVAKWLSVNKR